VSGIIKMPTAITVPAIANAKSPGSDHVFPSFELLNGTTARCVSGSSANIAAPNRIQHQWSELDGCRCGKHVYHRT
jgi:hypothetical protein